MQFYKSVYTRCLQSRMRIYP